MFTKLRKNRKINSPEGLDLEQYMEEKLDEDSTDN